MDLLIVMLLICIAAPPGPGTPVKVDAPTHGDIAPRRGPLLRI